jgi:flagella basal body P-ring formation protein FlgA
MSEREGIVMSISLHKDMFFKAQKPCLFALASLLALVAVFMASGVVSAADEWRIKVKGAVCVHEPVVQLGHIAQPVGDYDRDAWKRLASTRLWKASTRKGRPVVVPRAKLENILKYYLKEEAARCVLPLKMAIQTGGRVVAGQDLRNRVVEFLTIHSRGMGEDVEFKNFAMPDEFFLPNTYDKIELALSDEAMSPGTNRFVLRAKTPDGKITRTKTGSVFVSVWKTVPCASRPVNRNERLTSDKITFIKKNVAYMANVWDGEKGAWRVKRPVGTGQPFLMTNIEPMPMVTKGDVITLVYKNKRIQLTTKVEALGDGHLGQNITVRNLQSKRIIAATVVDNGVAKVR